MRLRDDPMTYTQAKTSAFAWLLRRKEWLKDTQLHFFWNTSRAIIYYFHQYLAIAFVLRANCNSLMVSSNNNQF
jgi:hypothetical protein